MQSLLQIIDRSHLPAEAGVACKAPDATKKMGLAVVFLDVCAGFERGPTAVTTR